MSCNSNGRVNILGENHLNCFQLYDKIPVSGGDTYYKTAMVGNWQNTILSNLFFSKENITIIQNGIRAGVYNKSNKRFLISAQNEDTLKIIMRSIFLQHSKNLAINIREQIEKLNKLVLDYSINQVYGEAEGYMKYKRDASTLVVPIAMPILSYSNDKQLELKKWF